jgi:nitric oxide reductase subunit C
MGSRDTEQPDTIDFWSSRCRRFTKELMLYTLVSGFILQTCLVYSDSYDTVKLTSLQTEGRRIWQRNNCQTCHQLHGFGGFLGPDLTNASIRVERSQLDELLTVGVDQMPAFHLPDEDINAVWAYLQAMNETGVGQARNPDLKREVMTASEDIQPTAMASTPSEALFMVIAEKGDENAALGFELFRQRSCLDCHVFFGRSSVGAPDLSISGMILSSEELDTVLLNGRLPKMPTPRLGNPTERQQVKAFIAFMAEHRTETVGRIVKQRGSYLSTLPWWEYQ